MNFREFLDNIFEDICLDSRIRGGLFDVSNPKHTTVLYEYISKYASPEFAYELMRKSNILTEGNYPERQAYNDDGILVTFPDAESKRAAIERGSHHDANPKAGSEGSESNGAEVEDEEGEDSSESSGAESDESGELDPKLAMFANNYESPESQASSSETQKMIDEFPIKSREGDESEGDEHHRIYDILSSMQSKIARQADLGDVDDFSLDFSNLDPSILFALSQKFEYDKGGNWYDEFNSFRGSTTRQGEFTPQSQEDRQKMLIWISDFLKRRKKVSSY